MAAEQESWAQDFADKHLSAITRGEMFVRQWLNFLREADIDEKDMPQTDELEKLADMVDDYVGTMAVHRFFSQIIDTVITVVSIGAFVLAAWLVAVLKDWNIWVGIAVAGIFCFIGTGLMYAIGDFTRNAREIMANELKIERDKIVEYLIKISQGTHSGDTPETPEEAVFTAAMIFEKEIPGQPK